MKFLLLPPSSVLKLATLLLLTAIPWAGWGAEGAAPAGQRRGGPPVGGRGGQRGGGYDDSILQAMDHGPFYSGVFNGRDLSLKGIAIKLGQDGKAGVVFDTLTMRYGDAWTGGFITIGGERTLGCNSTPIGEIQFATKVGPGWAKGGSFDAPHPRHTSKVGVDRRRGIPRHEGIADGPLPRDWAKYKGLYRFGEKVVLSYSVGKSDVLDQPGFEKDGDVAFFTRTLSVGSTREPLTALLWEDDAAAVKLEQGIATLTTTNGIVAVGLAGGSPGVALMLGEKGRILLTIPKSAREQRVQVVTARLTEGDRGRFTAFLSSRKQPTDLRAMTKGGPALWPEKLSVPGVLGQNEDAYTVDTIPVPGRDNPWKSWIRASGFDFFSDGRVALCSLSGDVWIVSGLNERLDRVTWKRFASGLYQPLGLKIVRDRIYVLGRDQITRFHDTNKDDEADFYENFNNDVAISEHYHEFCLNLETDSKGNFYFTKGGNLDRWKHPHHGCLLKVSADGKTLEVVATGLRAPNGFGIGPNNEFSSADNEGNWVPTSRVNLMKPGGFYGHVFTSHRDTDPTDYDKPLFWLAYNQDNSSGGQAWVTSKKWGPFQGEMLHFSYGKSALFKTWKQEVAGQVQGGYVRFPLSFESGIMRGRFSPFDGQLYTAGLRVWQSNGAKDGAFHRVRYTGKPVVMPDKVEVRKNGIAIRFTAPLDPATAKDAGSYAVDQWNYKWATEYGSRLYSVKDPTKAIQKSLTSSTGDPVEIRSVTLSDDRKTVFLELEEVVPVMQQHVRFNLNDATGAKLKVAELYHTINKVPEK